MNAKDAIHSVTTPPHQQSTITDLVVKALNACIDPDNRKLNHSLDHDEVDRLLKAYQVQGGEAVHRGIGS